MRLVLILILSVLLSSSCKNRNEEAARIKLEANLTMPAGLGIFQTHIFQVFDVPTFYESTIASAGIVSSSINTIQSGLGSFKSLNNNIDLDYIEGLLVHVLLDRNTGEKKEMFYIEKVPFGEKNEVRMLASTTELKDILNTEFIDLQFSFRLREINGQSFNGLFDLEFGIFVD